MSLAVFNDGMNLPAGLAESNPVSIVWRHRILASIVATSVVACAALALVVLPVRYLAAGSIIVAEPETGLAYPPAGWAQKVGDPADLESQLLLVRSPRVLRLVTEAPGVADMAQAECRRAFRIPLLMKDVCPTLKPGSGELVDYLQTKYTFVGAGRSRVITIGYSSSDPDVARDMANTLINVFLEDHRRGLMEDRSMAASTLGVEMSRLDGEIKKADADIYDYRRSKGLASGAQAAYSSERLSTINQQLANAETSRDSAAAILATANAGGDVAALPSVLASRTVADIKQRLAMASEEASAQAIVLGPRHPRLRSLQDKVSNLERRMRAEIQMFVGSAQKQFDAADGTARALRMQLANARAEASGAVIDESAIEQMVRDVTIKRQEYAGLYEKRKALESEERAILGSTRLVSLAERPLKKYFPKTTPFLAGGAALAVMAGVGAALLRDRFGPIRRPPNPVNRTPRTLPVLARLPRTAAGSHANLADDLGTAVESREMQAALRRLLVDIIAAASNTSRSVLMLSAFPDQGKTFTALALSECAARAGHRVLVIECDMRSPRLEGALGLKPASYLQDILRGDIAAQDAMVSTGIPRLDAIMARSPDHDPAELLAGHRMADLMEWAKSYDLVIFDSPALNAHMDAGLLAARVDGVLLCTREDEADPPAIAMVARRLSNLGANILGLVQTPNRRPDRAESGYPSLIRKRG